MGEQRGSVLRVLVEIPLSVEVYEAGVVKAKIAQPDEPQMVVRSGGGRAPWRAHKGPAGSPSHGPRMFKQNETFCLPWSKRLTSSWGESVVRGWICGAGTQMPFRAFMLKAHRAEIDANLRIDNCDIFIGIFWKRLGTPVKDAEAGSVHEFRLAYAAWKKQERPRIMMYFGERPYTQTTQDEVEQRRKVLDFKNKVSEKGGLYSTFASKTEFARQVRRHLTQLLHRPVPCARSGPSRSCGGEGGEEA